MLAVMVVFPCILRSKLLCCSDWPPPVRWDRAGFALAPLVLDHQALNDWVDHPVSECQQADPVAATQVPGMDRLRQDCLAYACSR